MLWAVAAALIASAGRFVLAPIDTAQGVAVVLIAAAGTAALVVPVTRDFLRRAGRDDLEAALLFGVVAGGSGLALDALLLLATGFDYPGVDAAHTPSLAVALMAAYAAFVTVPAISRPTGG